MLAEIFIFFCGVIFAPIIRPLIKPLFVECVKLIISASEEAKRTTIKIKEEMEDAVAMANAKREQAREQEQGPHETKKPAGDNGSAAA